MALGAQAALNAAGMSDVFVVGFDGSDDVNISILDGEIDAGALQPVAELATQAAIQADAFIKTGNTGKPEKQSIDMVLLTPENACQYTGFAPNGKTSCEPVAVCSCRRQRYDLRDRAPSGKSILWHPAGNCCQEG